MIIHQKGRMKDIRYSSNVMGNKMWILVCVWSILFASYGTEAFIGMTWGRQSAQRLVPSQVVDLLLQNGIRNARIYSSEADILEAFVDSGIELTVSLHQGVPLFLNLADARIWVRNKSKYLKTCSIRQVVIGSYVFTMGLKDKGAIEMTMVAMKNLQEALREVGHDGITVNLTHIQNMLKPNITRPSAADFSDQIKADVIQFVRHLQEHKAPFLLDTFPILDARRNYFNLSFAFMDNTGIAVKDVNGAVYTNVFEFTYDSIVWALTKINASDVKVVVSQVGWPTDGHVGGTAANAERFYRHLLPLVAGNKGTPMRPGAPLDIFVHSLADETKMYYADPFTRHWGVYRSNGQPKYRIDLTGRGRNVYPMRMGGIMRMPERWCIFNGNKADVFYVRSQLEAACLKGDCSSTTIGGSCSQLSFDQNVSYAFNMVFQFKFQDERSCDFGGLATVSVTDPSTPECVFPIEVVKGQQLNFYLPT